MNIKTAIDLAMQQQQKKSEDDVIQQLSKLNQKIELMSAQMDYKIDTLENLLLKLRLQLFALTTPPQKDTQND